MRAGRESGTRTVSAEGDGPKEPTGAAHPSKPRGPGDPDPDEAFERASAGRLSPGLYIVATPIGNLGDITERGRATLAAADLVACEDTRVTGRLLSLLGIKAPPLVAYHEHNAARVRPELVRRIAGGAACALVSDAGTPLVSDPGFRLVEELVAEGLAVTAVPGASAVLAALAVAGLPTDRFLFAGFLPPKDQARRAAIAELTEVPATLIWFETPPRLAASLQALADVLGPRPAAVARELTKRFEEVRRGTLAELARHYAEAGPPKGEIVLVVGRAEAGAAPAQDLDALLDAALARLPVKDAAAEVAALTGQPRRLVYARALQRAGRR
jgi:16S rRNA (cytidine1402-2'-O)-methyltransferase